MTKTLRKSKASAEKIAGPEGDGHAPFKFEAFRHECESEFVGRTARGWMYLYADRYKIYRWISI
jgi:hypothetical protein